MTTAADFVMCPVCNAANLKSRTRCIHCNTPRDGNVVLAAPSPVLALTFTRQQIEDRAGRVARAVTDHLNRGGEITEPELEEVVKHCFLYA